MSTFISDFATTVSTAKPAPLNNSFTVGDFIDGIRSITASSRSAGTFHLDQHLAAGLQGALQETMDLLHGMTLLLVGVRIRVGNQLGESSSRIVSITFSPAARSALPVSVMSTTTSTMSGILASVAP